MLRTNTRTKTMSPHDGATPTVITNGKAAKKGIHTMYPKSDPAKFDFSKPLVWSADSDWATEFNTLVRNPPLHSVVIEVAPEVAEQLLKLSNTKNRPKQKNHVTALSVATSGNNFELTGDTVKFSKRGVLLDGQHRLDGGRASKKSILTHAVFGLDDDIFDVLDQGKKRTPGDILALCGVTEPTLVAGAIGWVLRFESGLSGALDGGGRSYGGAAITPRKIRSLALGSMKGIVDYIKHAKLINIAYKHPPTMIAALLYLIGKRDPHLANSFAEEWVHGAKIGRNKNFDVLNKRIMSIAHANNGLVARSTRAALLIQTFNHWNAGIVASDRAMAWRKGWTFPTLEFNPDSFKEGKATEQREDTSLPAVKHRVHYVLTQMQDTKGFVTISRDEIAKLANVSRGSVDYILKELVRGRQISPKSTGAKRGSPSVYQVIIPAAEIKQVVEG